MPSRPCLSCGSLASGSYCPPCQQARQARRNARRIHYHGDYQRRATQVRESANRDPDTVCRRCGQPARPGDPWTAGHVIDSDPASPLAPEHRSCNSRAGASYGQKGR